MQEQPAWPPILTLVQKKQRQSPDPVSEGSLAMPYNITTCKPWASSRGKASPPPRICVPQTARAGVGKPPQVTHQEYIYGYRIHVQTRCDNEDAGAENSLAGIAARTRINPSLAGPAQIADSKKARGMMSWERKQNSKIPPQIYARTSQQTHYTSFEPGQTCAWDEIAKRRKVQSSITRPLPSCCTLARKALRAQTLCKKVLS